MSVRTSLWDSEMASWGALLLVQDKRKSNRRNGIKLSGIQHKKSDQYGGCTKDNRGAVSLCFSISVIRRNLLQKKTKTKQKYRKSVRISRKIRVFGHSVAETVGFEPTEKANKTPNYPQVSLLLTPDLTPNIKMSIASAACVFLCARICSYLFVMLVPLWRMYSDIFFS